MPRPRAPLSALPFAAALAACLLVLAARAGDPGPTPVMATLELRDGRVLHNVRVMSEEAESIVIRADEGLLKVAKSNLTKAAADAYPVKPPPPAAPEMVMQAFNPALPMAAPEQDPRPGPVPKQVPAPGDGPNPVFKGCTIVSFRMKPYNNSLGCTEVVIRNDGDTPATILPRDIVCLTAGGERLGGRQIVTDGFPPVVKRREIVPAHGSVDDQVTFVNEALDISSVQWAN